MLLQALDINCKRRLMNNGSQEQGESQRQTLRSFLLLDKMKMEEALDCE